MNSHYDVPDGRRLRLALVPALSVMGASLVTALPVITNTPMLPPLGFLLFIAWRLMRSDVWPIWAGIPLGFFDDLVSGQPVGSAVALWTIVMLAADLADRRIVWRDHWFDWVIGGVALLFVLTGGALLAHAGDVAAVTRLIGPQFLWSMCLLPLSMLAVVGMDSWRLQR